VGVSDEELLSGSTPRVGNAQPETVAFANAKDLAFLY